MPNVDRTHSETQWEVDEEDCGAELKQAEIIKVQEENVASRLLGLSSCSCLGFFVIISSSGPSGSTSATLCFLFLEVKLEDVVDLLLLTDCHILFLFNECVFGVFGQHFASGGLQFTNHYLSWHYFVDEIPHGHLDDLNTAQDMTPSDTIDYKLVNLFGTALEETPIILAVVVRLVFSIWATLLATNSWIIGLFTIIFLVKGAQHANDTFEEE